jgi:hypothetical protein
VQKLPDDLSLLTPKDKDELIRVLFVLFESQKQTIEILSVRVKELEEHIFLKTAATPASRPRLTGLKRPNRCECRQVKKVGGQPGHKGGSCQAICRKKLFNQAANLSGADSLFSGVSGLR